MKKQILFLSALAIMGAAAIVGCKKSDDTATTTPTASPTLYQQVGDTNKVADPHDPSGKTKIEHGRLTLRCVVDSAIIIIAGDTSMNKFFGTLEAELQGGTTTGYTNLSKNFTDFLAVATGGSKTNTYTGKNMRDAHNPAVNSRMGTKASSADFDRFLGDVGKSLNKNGVASSSKLYSDLVTLLETVKGDVVQK